MKHVFIFFFLLLLGLNGACFAQYAIFTARKLQLENRLNKLKEQSKSETDENKKKELVVLIQSLQQERDRINKQEDKELECIAPCFADDVAESSVKQHQSELSNGIQSQNSSSLNNSYQDTSSSYDLDGDTRIVKKYINQRNSTIAWKYMKKMLQILPSDPDVEFGYAGILLEIINGLTSEGTNAALSMDFAVAMTIQGYLNDVNSMYITLLATSASKGHQGALTMLQILGAMSIGGANINYNNQMNTGGSGTTTSRKKCSLCHGKGWIAGSKSPTYGNTGTYYCSECQRNVPQSHSHDRCPSCGGKGYVP